MYIKRAYLENEEDRKEFGEIMQDIARIQTGYRRLGAVGLTPEWNSQDRAAALKCYALSEKMIKRIYNNLGGLAQSSKDADRTFIGFENDYARRIVDGTNAILS